MPEVPELQGQGRGGWICVSLTPEPEGSLSTIHPVLAKALGGVARESGRGEF